VLLVDFKGLNSYSFSNMARSRDVGSVYRMQIQEYMFQHGVKKGCLIAEDKGTQSCIEIPIPYDKSVHERLVKKKDALFSSMKSLTPPPEEGFDINAQPCKWCDYKTICKSVHRTEEFLDEVKKLRKSGGDKTCMRGLREVSKQKETDDEKDHKKQSHIKASKEVSKLRKRSNLRIRGSEQRTS